MQLMEHPKQTPASMAQRVMRFDELKQGGVPIMFIDSVLPGHWRMNYAVVGDTASENPDFEVQRAITDPHKFQIGMGWAPPGCGPHWHTHDYVEMFFILEGQWRFLWGHDEDPDKPEGEFILNKWDAISLPAGVWRRFEVSGDSVGWFFAVLESHEVYEGKDPYWPPKVVQQAQEAGFSADENGKMVLPQNYDELNKQQYDRLLQMFKDLTGTEVKDYSPR
jgi:quercetin dioxygenase-like cupin family protein